MQQYWINQNGEQQGPFTLDELKSLRIDENAYAWFSGLEDWVKIGQIPELATLLEEQSEPAALEAEQSASYLPEPPVEPEVQDVPDVPDVPQMPASPPVMPPAPYGGMPEPMQPRVIEPRPLQPQPAFQPGADSPACPPTNLAWAIISTLLCCLPLGVVAIVMSFKVTKAYQEGDLVKAQQWSDRTAWVIIASIIMGIITSPLQMLVQALMAQ